MSSSTEQKAEVVKDKKQVIKSILDSELILKDTWAISVVTKGIHGFLFFERVVATEDGPVEQMSYRADLRPSSDLKSVTIGTEADINFEEITAEQLQKLSGSLIYALIPDVTPEKAKRILNRILADMNSGITYCLSGDDQISSKVAGEHHNCISYCQKVIKDELGVQIGSEGVPIKYPPAIVKEGIMNQNQKNPGD